METRVIDNYEEFLEIKHDWNELLADSRHNILFLTFEWLSAWWECYRQGNKLLIILVIDRGKIIAAAPLMIKIFRLGKVTICRKLQFIAHKDSDYLDFIVIGREQECFNAIFRVIMGHRHIWDWAEFVYLPATSPYFDNWVNSVGRLKVFRKKIVKDAVSVAIHLYKGASNYPELERILPNQERLRRVLRKKRNKLLREKQGVILTRTKEPSQIQEEIGYFVNQHRDRWETKGFGSRFSDTYYRAYLLNIVRKLASHNWVQLSSIKWGNEYIAMVLGFIYNDNYYHYLSTFNSNYSKYSPSQLLVRFLLEFFYSEGRVKKFDFLRGNEQYKYDWSNDEITLFKIELYPYKAQSFLIYIGIRISSIVTPKLKNIIIFLKKVKNIFIS